MMSLVVVERNIPTGADVLWELIADLDNLAQWMPKVQSAELLGNQRTGIGRRQKVVLHWRPGEWVQEQALITWEPGRRIGWRALTQQIRGRDLKQLKNLQTIITLSEREGYTSVRIETLWTPVGLRGKLFSRFFFQPAVRRQLKGALKGLERLAGRKDEL